MKTDVRSSALRLVGIIFRGPYKYIMMVHGHAEHAPLSLKLSGNIGSYCIGHNARCAFQGALYRAF